MSKIDKETQTIERFSKASRLGHNLHAVFFVILLVTGCAIAFKSFGNLIGSDMLKSFAKIHRYIAYVFATVPIIILLVFSTKNVARWLKDVFTFTKNDVLFLPAFAKSFFGMKAKTPPQGRYNGGEKINSIIQIFGFFIMVISGFILMNPDSFSTATVGWARPIHSFFGMALGAVIMGHAYLGLLNPDSKASLKGMLTGRVSMDFARSHHQLWVEEVEKAEAEKAAQADK